MWALQRPDGQSAGARRSDLWGQAVCGSWLACCCSSRCLWVDTSHARVPCDRSIGNPVASCFCCTVRAWHLQGAVWMEEQVSLLPIRACPS